MATIVFEDGTKVKFDGTPTQKDVEEVALQLKQSKPAPINNDDLLDNPVTRGIQKYIPGKVIGESLGTIAAAGGRALQGDFKGAGEVLDTQVPIPQLIGDYLKAGSTIVGAAAPVSNTFRGSAAQFGALGATSSLGQGLVDENSAEQIATETVTGGLTSAAFGGAFNLLGKAIAKAAPSVGSFTSGVPKAAIEQRAANPSVAKTGLKMSIEEIRDQAVGSHKKLVGDLKTEFGAGVDVVQQEYRGKLRQATQEVGQKFKDTLVQDLRRQGANEAAESVERSFDPTAVTSISALTKTADDAAGKFSNFPVVKSAIEKSKVEAQKLYQSQIGKDAVLDAQDALSSRANYILRKYGLGVSKADGSPQALFNKSSIVSGGEQSAVQEAVDTVNNWSDYTPKGLQSLAERLGALRKFDTPSGSKKSAVIGEIYNAVAGKKGVIDQFYPGLHELRTNYATNKTVLNEIESILSAKKDDPVAIQSSITRLSNLFKTDRDTYVNVIRQLGEKSGVDYLSLLAGTEFQKVLPGFVRGLGGGGAVSVGAAALNPYLLLLAPLFSPRAVGAIAQSGKALSQGTGALVKTAVSPTNQLVQKAVEE